MITCTMTGHRPPVSTRAVEMSTRPRYSVTAGSPQVPPRRPEEYAEPTEGLTTVPRDVKMAIEHIRAELAQPVTVADLTRVCGVAERTLHKHFQAFVGLSPLGYLRRMRLAAVRKRAARTSGERQGHDDRCAIWLRPFRQVLDAV